MSSWPTRRGQPLRLLFLHLRDRDGQVDELQVDAELVARLV
jgi:hypothetical protein